MEQFIKKNLWVLCILLPGFIIYLSDVDPHAQLVFSVAALFIALVYALSGSSDREIMKKLNMLLRDQVDSLEARERKSLAEIGRLKETLVQAEKELTKAGFPVPEGYMFQIIEMKHEKYNAFSKAASKMGMNTTRALNWAITCFLALDDEGLARQKEVSWQGDSFSGPNDYNEALQILGLDPQDPLLQQRDEEKKHFIAKRVTYAVHAQGQNWVHENPELVIPELFSTPEPAQE